MLTLEYLMHIKIIIFFTKKLSLLPVLGLALLIALPGRVLCCRDDEDISRGSVVGDSNKPRFAEPIPRTGRSDDVKGILFTL
jgi:hypothetical protein